MCTSTQHAFVCLVRMYFPDNIKCLLKPRKIERKAEVVLPVFFLFFFPYLISQILVRELVLSFGLLCTGSKSISHFGGNLLSLILLLPSTLQLFLPTYHFLFSIPSLLIIPSPSSLPPSFSCTLVSLTVIDSAWCCYFIQRAL